LNHAKLCDWLSKPAKFLGDESANELIHSLKDFEFFIPVRQKSIQYIRLIFLREAIHAMNLCLGLISL